jgi:hypothetical protein
VLSRRRPLVVGIGDVEDEADIREDEFLGRSPGPEGRAEPLVPGHRVEQTVEHLPELPDVAESSHPTPPGNGF